MRLVIDIDDEQVVNDIINRRLEPQTETDKVIVEALYNGREVRFEEWEDEEE